MVEFVLNNKKVSTDKPTGSLLLDYIRYDKALTGTKIGCREGDCGACTVLIGELIDGSVKYVQVTSCLTPIGNVHGKHVVTIEGLNMEDLTPVQQYMVDESGTQCGFCTVGFVVSLTGYCLASKAPNYEDAITAIDGNICRCTGYKSIERAARHITEALEGKDSDETVRWLVEQEFVPEYFNQVPQILKEITGEKPDDDNILVGGGTDLYVQRPEEMVELNVGLVASSDEMRFIRSKNGFCTIGGGSTVTDLLESEVFTTAFPRMWEHVKLVSSSPIRNISTIAGNFVNASPIGDFTAFFLALNSKITLRNKTAERTIDLKDFYKGYKDLDMNSGERITSISFKLPEPGNEFNLEKVSKRIHLDIASVNSAAQIKLEGHTISVAHISAGGVGPIPTYLHNTCEFLIDRTLNVETLRSANDIMQEEISPISDVRGSADYKRLLLRQLFYAHFIKLFPNLISLEDLR